MDKKLQIFIIIFLILFIGCNQHTSDNNIEKDATTKIEIKPKVVLINPDSLTIITPGENGVPMPKIVKAGKPKVVPYNGIRSIEAGTPKVIEIDQTKLKVITPGQGTIPLPRTYMIPDSGYTVQHGDTIYAPKVILASQPKLTPALPPRLSDAANCNMKYLDVDQGMTSSYIWAILEDKYGNLWFGTEGGGVSKYDGKSFIHYTEKEGLSNNSVFSILEDKEGNLWFGTWGGGVNKYDGKSFIHYTNKQGLGSLVVSILEDKYGNLWFGTEGGGVSKYDGKSFIHYTKKEGLSNNSVYSILEDKEGNLWFGTWKPLVWHMGWWSK